MPRARELLLVAIEALLHRAGAGLVRADMQDQLHHTPSAGRSLMRGGWLPACILARRARCKAYIEYEQADRAHKPGLPDAPGEGGDAEEGREARGGEGLDVVRQAKHAQRERRAGKRQQDGAD